MPELKGLTIYLNHVECALSFKGITFHYYKMLQNCWLTVLTVKVWIKSFQPPRLTAGAPCTNTYLLKPNLLCHIPKTPCLTEVWKAKMKCKQRHYVFQNLKKKSPGSFMKPKGKKRSGMIKKCTKQEPYS